MSIACLDSQYFIWAILERPSTTQTEMIAPAKAFFDYLDDTGVDILVPTPIVTELLINTGASEREALLQTLEERFWIREFDKLAATRAAEVWNAKKRDGVIQQLRQHAPTIIPPEKNGWMRSKIKFDVMILGTALAADATVLYTQDDGLAKLAAGFIPVKEMPIIHMQPELPNFPSALQPPSVQSPDAPQP